MKTLEELHSEIEQLGALRRQAWKKYNTEARKVAMLMREDRKPCDRCVRAKRRSQVWHKIWNRRIERLHELRERRDRRNPFHITSNGTDYGVYHGETAREALHVMLHDAGYETRDDAPDHVHPDDFTVSPV